MFALFLQMVRIVLARINSVLYWADNKISDVEHDRYHTHDHDDDDQEDDEDGPPKSLGEVSVALQQVYFGQLVIQCPACEYETEEVGMGLSTIEHDETDENGLPEMIQIGIVCYPCGHTVHGPALLDSVARVLNAKEEGHLTPKMIIALQEEIAE